MNILILILLVLLPKTTQAIEPTIHQLQAEAIRYMGYNGEEMERWQKRARWSAALPRLQAGFDQDFTDVVKFNTRDNVSISGGDVFIGPSETTFDENLDHGTSFEVKAIWYLDELVFSRDSLAVSGERRDWMRERNRILQDLTEAYYARTRLSQELQEKREPLEIRERKKLLLDRATATLDALTGGWYSRQIEL